MTTRTMLILGAIGILLLAGVAFFVLRPKPEPAPGNEATFPTAPDGSLPSTNSGMLEIALLDGSARAVPNFTDENQPEVASPENGYQVAGDASVGPFQVLYFPETHYFLISLFEEPLGQARLQAEAALRQKLGLSDADLCALHTEVLTSVRVNELYAGYDLGLSFCPDATRLP